MKTLLLMRHAKSTWDDPQLSDRDRPLNHRGEKDAARMGKMLKHEDLIPQAILSSTAVRASQTAEILAEKAGYKGEITYLDGLYLAEPAIIIEALRQLPADVKKVLVVAHNPGMEGLVQVLCHKVESMPTAAIALFKIPVDSWEELTLTTEADLKHFWKPRSL